MAWLALVRALVSLALTLTEFARTRQLIAVGEANEIAHSLRAANDRIALAVAARRAARDRDRDPARLHDDDGYKRDD